MNQTSLLLHALSLNDRVLEPNQLPVSGHVWAYEKREVSREVFVGNCMGMLSLLDIQDAEISWEDEIMAFDATREGQPVTVIISLQDDSLASRHFYFLGVWARDEISGLNHENLPDWQGEELLMPAMHFSVAVSEKPMQLPVIREMVGGELFAQKVCDESYYLCGYTQAYPIPSAVFVICPTSHAVNQPRQQLSHLLYSLRNLMGLMSSVMTIYDQMSEHDMATQRYKTLMALMAKMDQEITSSDWDGLVRENGRISFELASELMVYRNLENETQAFQRLFESIMSELDVVDMKGIPSLFDRMQLPFELIGDIFADRFRMIERAEKQTQILQPLMHSRMLASQQVLLERLLHKQDKTTC